MVVVEDEFEDEQLHAEQRSRASNPATTEWKEKKANVDCSLLIVFKLCLVRF